MLCAGAGSGSAVLGAADEPGLGCGRTAEPPRAHSSESWEPARWLQDAKPRPAEIRFDVAAIVNGEIEVLEGAF